MTDDKGSESTTGDLTAEVGAATDVAPLGRLKTKSARRPVSAPKKRVVVEVLPRFEKVARASRP